MPQAAPSIKSFTQPTPSRRYYSRVNIGTSLRLGYQTQLSLPLTVPPVDVPRAAPTLPEPDAPEIGSLEAGSLDALRNELRRRLGLPVRIEVHDNRSTMVSYRRAADGFAIRMHRMFLPPPLELAETLAAFVSGRGQRRAAAGRWLDDYIRDHRQVIREPRPTPTPPSRGRTRDLKPIFDALNQRYFGGAIQAEIGWSRASPKRRRRSIKMGVYLHDHRHIRIHPALDRPEVPDYLVEFVVYHEMCHQVCPPEPGSGHRKRVHTRAFRERERMHPERDRALSWEKKNLKLLLRAERIDSTSGYRDSGD
jgi:hypothetical protein